MAGTESAAGAVSGVVTYDRERAHKGWSYYTSRHAPEAGRAFEVAADHTVVWEFLSPHRAGERGELIAMLFELVRLDADFPTDWAADRLP